MDEVTRLVTFAEVDGRASDRLVSVSARLEAELADGRRVVLLDDRGWGASGPADVWAYMTIDDAVDTARTVVGPDEPPEGRTHDEEADLHWAALAQTARRGGAQTTADELRRLPHDVVLGAGLRARLPG